MAHIRHTIFVSFMDKAALLEKSLRRTQGMSKKGRKHFIFSFGLVFFYLLCSGQATFAQTPTCDITWRKIDGTRVISTTLTIPAGQTVCIEPGVRVEFVGEGKIVLDGRLIGMGASDDRIQLVGTDVFPNKLEVRGTLDLRFTDSTAYVRLFPGANVTYRDCNLGAFAGLGSSDPNFVNFNPTFVLIENSTLDSDEELASDNASIYLSFVHIVLRNVTVRRGAWVNINRSYIYIDNYNSQNARRDGIEFLRLSEQQPLFLNNINVTGAGDAGLRFLAGNYFIGENVTLVGNKYPVRGGAGILPGSNIPATGNLNNWIELDGGMQPFSIFAPQSVPYVASGGLFSGSEILPGAIFKMRPNVTLNTFGNTHGRLLGLPDAPLTFEPFVPEQKWNAVEFHQTGDRMEHTIIDGTRNGFTDTDISGVVRWVDNSIWRNNDIAINDPHFDVYYIQGNLFTNNGVAVNLNGPLSSNFSGETNPNLFENNGVGVRAINGANPFIPFNWWNSPTGPTTQQNPGGTGDIIEGPAQFQPFRTVRPDRTDHPPVVRLPRRPFQLTAGGFDGVIERGQKVILTWNAFDNASIVRQKILFSANGNRRENFVVMADNLPGNQRSYEFTMPDVGVLGGTHKFIRIVAVDALGQEGYDEWQVQVPTGTEPGELVITTPLAGQTFRGGQFVQINWSITLPFNSPQFRVFVLLDGDRKAVFSANGGNTGTFGEVVMPLVSTDSARIAVHSQGGANQVKWFYSQPFSIRADARWPDAPPQITMTSPQAGQSFPVLSLVPISWTATDDEALRSFSILYSTDGGRTWLTLVENLPPETTSYNWQTPPGAGFNDVRVRVVAFDRRFQNSSDGANRSFRLTSGPPLNVPPAVQITFPANNASYNEGQSVLFAASASDPDGTVVRVEFYDGANFLGSDASAPYQIAFNNPSVGTHAIKARAVDNLGATSDSVPINVTIIDSPGPTPLPVASASLTAPANETVYDAPASITISASASGGTQGVNRVDFFLNTTLVGTDTTAPYSITVNDIPAGRYAVFARTTAGNGVQAYSQQSVDITVRSTTLRRAAFDFDGDGKTDVSVYRGGTWYLQQSTNGFAALQFGAALDRIAPADFDGDGKTDIAVFRAGAWYIQSSLTGNLISAQFGQSGDAPVPCDYDGDNKADLAVFRAGAWYIMQSSNNSFRAQLFGQSGDMPVAADYDGDGKFDLAVFRNGIWYLQQSSSGFSAQQFGIGGDKPVTGDYDGDGKSDLAVYRQGNWYIQQSSDGSFRAQQFGLSDDLTTQGDYDGDGKTDVAVFRNGNWYVMRSASGFMATQFGLSSDQPVPAAFVP